MSLAIYFFCSLLFAAFQAYTMRWQGATLYWGLKLTPANEYLPRGSQDAITPSIQTTRMLVLWIWLLALIVIGLLFFRWYVVLITVILTWVISGLIAVLFVPSSDSAYFRLRIRNSLVQRIEGYKRSSDDLRATLAQQLLEELDVLDGENE